MTRPKCVVLEGEPVDELASLLSIETLRVPVVAPDAEARVARHLAGHQVHAALSILSPASLSDSALGRCLALCADEAEARDDFRLFVVLKGVRPSDVDAAPIRDIARLSEIVQFVAHDDLEAMKADLSTYFANLRQIVIDARVRWFKVEVASLAGRMATAAQLAGLITVIALWTALQRYPASVLVTWLGGWLAAGAFLAQLPFVAAVWLPTYALVQPRTMRLKDIVFSGGAVIVLGCCLTVAESLEVDQWWAMAGQHFGFILDFLRRRGRHADWRKVTLRAIDHTRSGGLDGQVQGSVDDFVVDPLTCPLLSELVPRVFISYTTRSTWSAERAHLIAHMLTEAGTTVFLDRMFIDKGMNWHRELRRRISDSNVFISLTDAVTMTREWTARELETALRGRALTGTPYTLVLRRKGTLISDDSLPAFRAVLDGSRQLPGRLEVIDWNEKTSIEALVWMLRKGHFYGAAVLPTRLSRPIHALGQLLFTVARASGWLVGIAMPLILLGGVELPSTGFAAPLMTVGISAWLGFVIRVTFACTFEARPSRSAPAFVHALAALGLLMAVAARWPLASNPIRAWIGMSALYGWLLATWGIETRLMQPIPARADVPVHRPSER